MTFEPGPSDASLAAYVCTNYSHLFTSDEAVAARSVLADAKAEAYGGVMADHLRQTYITSTPAVQQLLAAGVPAFRLRVCQRILVEHSAEVFLNRCPKCDSLARTPTACLCPACNHSWYDKRRQ